MMIAESNALIIELWERIKPSINSKERMDVANSFLTVFDDYGLLDEKFLEEDLDRPLKAAAKSILPSPIDEVCEEDLIDDDPY